MGRPTSALCKVDEFVNLIHCVPDIGECKSTSNQEEEDQFSKLTDDILVVILSWLKLKEAAGTSTLSRRWRYLWLYTSGSLDFDNFERLCQMPVGDISIYLKKETRRCMNLLAEIDIFLKNERCRFLDMVKQVLESHRGSVIDTFRVSFGSGAIPHEVIDGWIEFALRKRVKRLELDFTSVNQFSYNLPTKIFNSYCLDNLHDVCLTEVQVTGEILEFILSSCPLLEILIVEYSRSLVSLKLPGPLLKLRVLSIVYCSAMEHMDVSGINICSFTYRGPEIRLFVKDVLSLNKLDVGCDYASFMLRNISYFSDYLSQLEALALDLGWETRKSLPRFPVLQNLRKLELSVPGGPRHSVLFITSIFEACPILDLFVLKLPGFALTRPREPFDLPWIKKPKQKVCGHGNLKVVEIVEFAGYKFDLEFARFILKNVVSLEKLILDPQLLMTMPWRKYEDAEIMSQSRTRARQLEPLVPDSVQLVIL